MKYYKVDYKYVLAEDETYQSNIKPAEEIHTDFISLYPSGKIVLKARYAWNGSSGGAKDDDTNKSPSGFHDAVFQLIILGLLPLKWMLVANADFIQMCLDRGMWRIRAWYYRKLLNKFCAEYCKPACAKKILEAP